MRRPALAPSLRIDPGNGAVVWSKRIGEPIRSAPTAAGGKIYFVSADNILYALNDQDGQQLWTSRGLPQAATLLSNVSPAVSGGVVVAPFPSGDVAAFESGSGKATWRESLGALERDLGCRRSRRSGAAGDRSRGGVRGQPRRQDDRRVGVVRRAVMDAKYRQHADAVDRGRHRLCRRSRTASSLRWPGPTARCDG